MDMDLDGGLGDELVGLENLEYIFPPNGAPDLFKFCAFDEAEHGTAHMSTAPPSPGSANGSGGGLWLVDPDKETETDNWSRNALPFKHPSDLDARGFAMPIPPAPQRGKPRARKRHEENESRTVEDAPSCQVPKRRSSANSVNSEERVGGTGDDSSEPPERSCSFDAPQASWNMSGSETKIFVQHPEKVSTVAAPCSTPGIFIPQQRPARDRAIKVKPHLMSAKSRPRISVFMSGKKNRPRKTFPGLHPSRHGIHRPPGVSMLSTSLPGTFGSLPRADAASAQGRIKDLRIMVRSPLQKSCAAGTLATGLYAGEQPPSSPKLDQSIPPAPVIRRASSVSALKIVGNGDVISSSPVMSSMGDVLQPCELSDEVMGGNGQRRNLVCSVFACDR